MSDKLVINVNLMVERPQDNHSYLNALSTHCVYPYKFHSHSFLAYDIHAIAARSAIAQISNTAARSVESY